MTDRLWNANYIKVMTANFALFFAFYVLTPLLPLYLSEHFHGYEGHYRHRAVRLHYYGAAGASL